MTTTTMNIYQAALQLRNDYAHTGIDTDACDDAATNLYFIMHDALHTYVGARPQESDEPIVLATEMVLGGQDYSVVPLLADVTPDEISTALSNINPDMIEFMMDFYTQHFGN